ncbi:alpha/beta fold hydrolase [Rhodobacterales bacterium HKCCSP123]|nr:alpha/beta fold hydrolase [Rhodobacterales bacterium HKCCSP123]
MTRPARPTWENQFPDNFMWSNATLVCKGMAPYGVVALGDIDRIAAYLEGQDVSGESWCDAWEAVASERSAQADAAAAEGRDRTAGQLYLRAGYYYYTGERFLPPGNARKRQASERAYDCFSMGFARAYPEISRHDIHCDGAELPALFFPAKRAKGPAPTVVVVNGMDNAKEMSVLFAGSEFSERGFNTLALDGPGQGESLRLRGIHARHDYEVPARLAHEMLSARPDVDGSKIAILGYSFGGAYAARIAAHAPEFAAGVALTAGHWDLQAFQRGMLEKARAAQKSVAQSNFQFQYVVGESDPEKALEVADRFSVRHSAPKIGIPFLVTHGAEDRVIPVANAQKLYDAIPDTTPKALKIFTAEEGGSAHAHVDDRMLGISFAADWLSDVLTAKGD